MERQYFIEQLRYRGELHPYRNIRIWTGQKVSEMVFYCEAIKLRGLYLSPEKYYVFETDKGRIFVCDTPEEAVDTASNYSAFDYNMINIGDYVDFGLYGKFYVCGENVGGTKFLVTGNHSGKRDSMESVFYIEKHYAEGIIKKDGD